MKLVWAQIKNYRSISDSGKIYFNPNLTILAGKNESGKSNILKALDRFSKEDFDKDNDYPIDYINKYPEVIVHYELEDSIRQYINDTFSVTKGSDNYNNGVTVTRTAETDEIIEAEVFKPTLEHVVTEIGKIISSINKEFKTKFRPNIENITSPNIQEVIEEISICFTNIRNTLNSDQLNQIDTVLSDVNSYLDLLTEYLKYCRCEEFQVTIPNFVYFSSFEDIIPDSIAI